MEDLNRSQFVYKRTVQIPPVEADEENGIEAKDAITKVVLDSFDIERVIRAITMDDGRLLVLLDDIHERYETKPKTHPKTGQPRFDKKGQMIFERIKETFQSEVYLSEEEKDSFLKLTSINDYEQQAASIG